MDIFWIFFCIARLLIAIIRGISQKLPANLFCLYREKGQAASAGSWKSPPFRQILPVLFKICGK